MVGYDESAAAKWICARLGGRADLVGSLEDWVREMITLDLRYMTEFGVLDEDGYQGDEEYDTDEAFEYIYGHLMQMHPDIPDDDLAVAELVGEFMDQQDAYMCQAGLAE